MSPRKTDTEVVWGAYVRLSRLKSRSRRGTQHRGRFRNPDESVERQLKLIRGYADEHGLNLPDELIYRDNGRSAWRRDEDGKKAERPGWDAMLADGKAGEFGGLLVWKLDRFARNVRDGEDLLDLGVRLDGPDTGRINLRTAHGKSIFRKQIEAATHQSNETSEKVRAAFTDMLDNGYRVSGSGRAFGFEILSQADLGDRDWADDDDARFGGPAAVVREEEAEIIRDVARRLLAGETLQLLAAELNERGITTTRGGQWKPSNLGRVVGNPLMGGHLAYRGEIVGKLANVEPILDEDTFQAVQAKLGARKLGRRPTGKWPLSGVARCGNPACSKQGTLAGFTRSTSSGLLKRSYVCAPASGGCGQSVLAEPVEALVRDKVLADLADVEALEGMRDADVYLDEQRAKLRQLLDDLDADMAETEAKRAATPRSQTRLREQYEKSLRNMQARYEAAERELAELGPTSAPAPPLPTITAEEWEQDTTAAGKAAYIRQLGLRITIMPPTRKQGASRLPFDERRVVIEP